MEVMDYDGNPRLRIREMSDRGTEREIVIPVSVHSIKVIGELLSTLAMGAYDQF